MRKLLLLALSPLVALLFHADAKALSGADFNPGRIIDDVVFQNKDSMTVTQIQQFLDSKVSSCDRNGDKLISAGTMTRRAWATLNGKPLPPYTCLREYQENPITKENNIGRPTYQVPDGRSAAQLIWDVSQAQNINPQVLLVLLQKEQSLITDDWPWPRQYEAATGANCPDTAPCDPLYAGFYAQIFRAASLFNYYVNNLDEFNYAPGWNNILYHPFNTYCGTQRVFIENRFTAALYIYTPYVPNQAALDNIYGDGDIADPAPPNCSSFGNRNFWRMFNDWFGSSLAPFFMAQPHGQPTYQVLTRGETKKITMDFKNVGTAFWKDDLSTFPGYAPIRLASTSPINRWSAFRDSTWMSGSRPTGIFSKVFEANGTTLADDQHTVLPQQIVRFEFNIKANDDIGGGVYRETFQPILEGSPNWNLSGTGYQDIGVHVPVYRASFDSQSEYATLGEGETKNSYIQFRNVGNEPWYTPSSVPAGRFPVNLATSWPINRASSFGGNWTNPARPSIGFQKVYNSNGTLAADQSVVQPNQIARFEFDLRNNGMPGGNYKEYFEPILEGAPGYSWNLGASAWLGVTVPQPISSATFAGQSAYPTISRGSSAAVFLRFKNTGNTTWYDGSALPTGKYPIRLATSWPINRVSQFGSTWTYVNRPAVALSAVYLADGITLSANQQKVAPGEIGHFQFTLSVPASTTPGFYREYFEPILEGAPGYSWNLGASAWLGITVQ